MKKRMKKLKGFTLAEVLITLGIIGVVAAMTLPTLISNYQKVALETAYKKGMSVIANAIQLAMAKNETPGDLLSLPIAQCYDKYIGIDRLGRCLAEENKALFSVMMDTQNTDFYNQLKDIKYNLDNTSSISNIFFPPAYAIISVDPTHVFQTAYLSFLTPDGIIYGYHNSLLDENNELFGFTMLMDVNGPKNPNKANVDLYLLAINKRGKVVDMTCEMIGTCTEDDYERVYEMDIETQGN